MLQVVASTTSPVCLNRLSLKLPAAPPCFEGIVEFNLPGWNPYLERPENHVLAVSASISEQIGTLQTTPGQHVRTCDAKEFMPTMLYCSVHGIGQSNLNDEHGTRDAKDILKHRFRIPCRTARCLAVWLWLSDLV